MGGWVGGSDGRVSDGAGAPQLFNQPRRPGAALLTAPARSSFIRRSGFINRDGSGAASRAAPPGRRRANAGSRRWGRAGTGDRRHRHNRGAARLPDRGSTGCTARLPGWPNRLRRVLARPARPGNVGHPPGT